MKLVLRVGSARLESGWSFVMLGDSSNTGFNHMVLAGFALIPDLIRIEPAAQPEIAIRVGLCD